ncbi:MAG: glutamate racemase [Deltaproteobacteria bacterium]|nr:glutamate racemase [Deltaproteobacteria bacterium]
MQSAHRPRIAIFDSGIGGLTVARAVRDRLPGADLRYLGDTARLPYGTKTAETVTRYALQAARALLGEDGADALVVACNTASSCALPALEAECGLPVLGVIAPGARRAVAASPTGQIGVIGTERTVASGAYTFAIEALRQGASVHGKATPLLVGLAEEGFFSGPLVDAALDAYLGPWLERRGPGAIDALVLGCTHYPVFKEALAAWLGRRLGREVALIDSAEAIADELATRFPSATTGSGATELLATDGLERFRRVGSGFFPMQGAALRLVDL